MKLSRLGGRVSAGVLRNWLTLAGATLVPAIRTLVGNCGATTLVLPSNWPPTMNSCTRCSTLPSWRSLPSPSTPLTGSTLTYRLLSIKLPVMRTRASVPVLKLSALAPVPPRAASSPRSAPTSRCRLRASRPTCSNCSEATARSPDASARVMNWVSAPSMLSRHAPRVLPAEITLARPCTLQTPPTMLPPTCTAPNVKPLAAPDRNRSVCRSPLLVSDFSAAASMRLAPAELLAQRSTVRARLAPAATTRLSVTWPRLSTGAPAPPMTICDRFTAPRRKLPTPPARSARPRRSALARSRLPSAPLAAMPVSATRDPSDVDSDTTVLVSVPLSCSRKPPSWATTCAWPAPVRLTDGVTAAAGTTACARAVPTSVGASCTSRLSSAPAGPASSGIRSADSSSLGSRVSSLWLSLKAQSAAFAALASQRACRHCRRACQARSSPASHSQRARATSCISSALGLALPTCARPPLTLRCLLMLHSPE